MLTHALGRLADRCEHVVLELVDVAGRAAQRLLVTDALQYISSVPCTWHCTWHSMGSS